MSTVDNVEDPLYRVFRALLEAEAKAQRADKSLRPESCDGSCINCQADPKNAPHVSIYDAIGASPRRRKWSCEVAPLTPEQIDRLRYLLYGPEGPQWPPQGKDDL